MSPAGSLPILLLLVALGSFLSFLRGDVLEYRRLKALRDTASRQRRFAIWAGKALMLFGVVAVAELALLGRLRAIVAFPAEFAPAAALVAGSLGEENGPLPLDMIAGGAIGGVLAGSAIAAILARRPGVKKPVTLGEFDAILPRNRAELAWGAVLSVNAGVTEELFFRLLLPLLITLITGDALIGFALAAVLFGVAHLYQGWVGVLATLVLGLLLTGLYLASGSLWTAMLFHAAIDLNGLVVRPIVTGRVGR